MVCNIFLISHLIFIFLLEILFVDLSMFFYITGLLYTPCLGDYEFFENPCRGK